MATYEQQYMTNLKNIYENGYYGKNERTGIYTYRLPSTQIIVDLAKEFPILLSKKVFWKSAGKEILWMTQKQSNNIKDLGSKIWDQWASPDGSIGKTYGYQYGKYTNAKDPITKVVVKYKNQIEYILTTLAKDPSNRQCVCDLWDPEELAEMNLPPCVYSSVWSIIDHKLNLMLVQRSSDYPVGVPFDTTEYAILVHMLARHLGVEVGILTHVMADSHIYANQIDGVKQLFAQYDELQKNPRKTPKLIFKDDAPTNFWEMSIDDIDIVDYEPMPVISFEVAV